MNISQDSTKSFILYGRVSSKGQFSSGLSIDAQQKLALAQAKARGVKLGRQGSVLAKLNQDAAREYYDSIKQQVIQTLKGSRKRTLQSYATKLNKNGVQTRTGGKWYPQTVKNMFRHLDWEVKSPSFV